MQLFIGPVFGRGSDHMPPPGTPPMHRHIAEPLRKALHMPEPAVGVVWGWAHILLLDEVRPAKGVRCA